MAEIPDKIELIKIDLMRSLQLPVVVNPQIFKLIRADLYGN